MKALILATALVVSTTFSIAQEAAPAKETKTHLKTNDLEVAILQKSEDQVNLLLAKTPGDPVKIKVYEDSELLFSQRVKKAGTANIKYDISQFPDGEYTFKLEKDNVVVYSVKVRKGATALAGTK